ncbi:hypothetical protein [Solwaraspora sp. WMMD792]|uniref:phage terminase small subunit n=1 Tax=Solwaraspora sp. WMMD792 TaxID=3016099 RepID=UPI002415A1FC|nr:hypothetical protein [Solwaraspora sp. WMMD792]MDG4768938.1 hypothetical protein [Solwaraspora sp. WMMD792]MDG4769013.1 hypothetical protein [Solwaraspora sp. WMMD792]
MRHRVPAVHDWVEVPDLPYDGDRPSLPTRMVRVQVDDKPPAWETRRGSWPAATRRWWETVSTMPHCRLWTSSDWQFAIDTAEVHARWAAGETSATELRIREKLLGTTLNARRDLRIRYVDPPSGPAGGGDESGVVQLDDYRDLYG